MTDVTKPPQPQAGDVGEAGGGAPDGGRLDPRAQDRIGAMLRQHFDDLVAAPVPDRLLVLLAELEAREQALDKEKRP